MVEAIKHDIRSSAATTSWETVKGGIRGTLYTGLIGAAVVGGIAAGLTAMVFSIPAALAVGAVAAVAGGASAIGTLGVIGGPIGAIGGFFRGRQRVGAENTKYAVREAKIADARAQEAQMIATIGAQQGYAMGFEHGQQKVVHDIQSLQQQMLQQEMAKSVAAGGGHAAKCGKCAGESKVEAVAKQREAQAAAGNQIG